MDIPWISMVDIYLGESPQNGSKWTLQADWCLVLCKRPAFQLQVIEQEPPSKDDQDEDDGHGEAARRSRRRRCL